MSDGRRRAEARGRGAERLAALLLMAKGYRVLARRYRCAMGEIDLVAARGSTLAFIEVKAREEIADGLEALTPRARARILAAARHWLMRHPGAADAQIRFDVIALAPWRWPRHIAGAFEES